MNVRPHPPPPSGTHIVFLCKISLKDLLQPVSPEFTPSYTTTEKRIQMD